MTILLPLLIAIVGALVYALADGKPAEIGRIMLWTGLLATLLQSDKIVTLLR